MQIHSAEWVLPVSSRAIRDGVVAVESGKIAWVGPRRELPSRFLEAPLRVHPHALLLPGWVNAHAHLNLTAALGQVPGTAEGFADWVRRLIALREQWPPTLMRQATVAGLDLLASTGTTTTAHLSTLPDLEPFLEHPVRSVVFHEAIGFPEARAADLLTEARDWVDAAEALIQDAGAGRRITVGLAPHAPYTASPALIRGLWKLAGERRLPYSIHLAETTAEGEFLRTGTGSLRALLEERGGWDAGWSAPGATPVRYLADLLAADSAGTPSAASAIHCNYLTAEDVAILAGSRLAVVWCPGSHRFFGHPRHPAAELIAAGAAVALGTDSVASNAGLNMLREVRLAAEALPGVPRETWLRAGTLTGAEALGLGALTGSLDEGKAADLQILERAPKGPPDEETDPLSALFEAKLRVRFVLVDGAEIKIR